MFLHTIAFRVEHTFLIHRESGILLQHVFSAQSRSGDPDLISAMLTAIQDFVTDAFDAPEGDRLRSFAVGEMSVWVEYTDNAILAAVIRGQARQASRAVFREALEFVQLDLGKELATFAGDIGPFIRAQPYLERCLLEKRVGGSSPKKKQKNRSGTKWAMAAVAVAVLAPLGFWWYTGYRESKTLQAFVEQLRQEPGIVITSVQDKSGQYHLLGLRDPLAADPQAIARSSGIDSGRVVTRLEPYIALHPELIRQRAEKHLSPPSGVELRVAGDVLTVHGSAPKAWLNSCKRPRREFRGSGAWMRRTWSTPRATRSPLRSNASKHHTSRYDHDHRATFTTPVVSSHNYGPTRSP